MSRLFNRFKFNSTSFNNFTSSRKFSSIQETLLSNRGDPNFKYKAGFLALMPICSLYLGIWQVKRLKWKEDLIQKVEEKRAHEPILLPSTLTPELYDELEYRPVIIRGRYLCDREILVGLRNHEGKSGYVVYTPFKREDTDQIILVRRGWVEKSMKKLVKGSDEVVTIRGQVRKGEIPNRYTPPNSPRSGQWFYVNIEEMAEFVGCEPVLVDAIAGN
jgi:surfeit locus 1 family protein